MGGWSVGGEGGGEGESPGVNALLCECWIAGKACCCVYTRDLPRRTTAFLKGIPAPPSHGPLRASCLPCRQGHPVSVVCVYWQDGLSADGNQNAIPFSRTRRGECMICGAALPEGLLGEARTQGTHDGQAKGLTNHKPGNKVKVDDVKHKQEEKENTIAHNIRIRMPQELGARGMGGRAQTAAASCCTKTVV